MFSVIPQEDVNLYKTFDVKKDGPIDQSNPFI